MMRSLHTVSATLLLALACACTAEVEGEAMSTGEPEAPVDTLAAVNKQQRYAAIRDAAVARGFKTGYLLAGIANTESGLAMCHNEAKWACPGPNSPDCGNTPIIAGRWDGECWEKKGGLGMFQFDAGVFSDTLRKYGNNVLTIDGQIEHAINYTIWMVKVSAYTRNADTDAKARAWIQNFDPNNATLRDQWIKTVLRYYNGCQPSWSCWRERIPTYTDGYNRAINDVGGVGFWGQGGGTTCGNSPRVVGAIDTKYKALGGCGSILGRPITAEMGTPDSKGRYTVFEKGSIYWTGTTGAFAVHGVIRDKWKELGWEVGYGYPLSDEIKTPDGRGRFNVFQVGSIYWTEATGAREVRGRIRDKYKELGWETGRLGYPTSDETTVPEGKKSSFEGGTIVWNSSTDTTTVTFN